VDHVMHIMNTHMMHAINKSQFSTPFEMAENNYVFT